MKHQLAALAVLTTTMLSTAAMADGWVWGPAFKDGWKPDFTGALVLGSMDPQNGASGEYKGAELSLNCPWFQPPTGSIRQQFNIGHYQHDNVSMTSFEMNPNYFVSIAPGWTVGAGPGIGFVRGYIDDHYAVMASLQVSANINYRKGAFFFGAGARYQDTRDKEIVPGKSGMDNWLLSAKVGINF